MIFQKLVVALALAMAGAGTALAQAPAEGVWQGVGLQAGPGGTEGTWQIRMTIKARGDSAIEYPDLKCKGVLKRVANGHDGFEFNERITEGGCVDRGRIVVRERSGRVSWFWYRPGLDGPDASAVLYRDQPIS